MILNENLDEYTVAGIGGPVGEAIKNGTTLHLDELLPVVESTRTQLAAWGEFDELRDMIHSRLFGVLVTLAEGVVKEFHSDLFWDAKWVKEHVTGSMTFMYLVRHSGTCLGSNAPYMRSIGAGHLYQIDLTMNERKAWFLTITEQNGAEA